MYDTADNQSRSLVTQLHLSAAFDTLYKKTLLRWLDHTFGINGTTHKWINSYLDGQNQFVRVGDHTSEPVPCEFGVPQSSVLGLLLFTIYTSPITNVIAQFKHVNHDDYADDTQLYVALNTDDAIRVINDCFKSVHYWLGANGLSQSRQDWSNRDRHGHKTQVRRKNLCCHDCWCYSSNHTTVKSSGVTIDSTLSFDQHVNNVYKAAYYHIRAIRHIRRCESVDDAEAVATALVSSRLDYCNSVLFGTSQSNLNKLQRVQNAVTRTVMATSKRKHITPVLDELHWLLLLTLKLPQLLSTC